jgi:parallel beta-helix repeat protein
MAYLRLKLRGQRPAADYTPTLWVNASTGSDSHSRATVRAGGGSVQWATLRRATHGSAAGATVSGEAADAGDAVLVVGNHSIAGTGTRFDPAYNPVNEGTAVSPLVFYTTTNSVLALSSSEGAVIGYSARDYVIWDGFRINGVDSPTTSDTGHVDVDLCTGVELRNLRVIGDGSRDYSAIGGNYNAIRFEDCDECRAYNCELSEIFEDGGTYGGNTDGIGTYDCRNLTIEHCTIYNCGQGIYIKGQHGADTDQEQTDVIIRYNRIYDCGSSGIGILGVQRVQIYQNIIYYVVRGERGILVFGWPAANGSPSSPTDADIYNNTIDGCRYGVSYLANGNNSAHYNNIRVWNNVVYRGLYAFGNEDTMTTYGDVDHQHNVYNGQTAGSSRIALYAESGSQQYYTLVQWKAALSGNGADNQDSVSPAAIGSDPLFVDVSSRDYHLQVGSPARDHGRTFAGATVHAGAYITGSETIGVE